MEKTAEISQCGQYRYRLTRTWDVSKPKVLFVMLNPSTADAQDDDPTIRRCIGFAKSWDCGSLAVVNLFAFRSTKPKGLYTTSDPIGLLNNGWLHYSMQQADMVVFAWGNHGRKHNRKTALSRLLHENNITPYCLGLTKLKQPIHPLFVKADAPLVPFSFLD